MENLGPHWLPFGGGLIQACAGTDWLTALFIFVCILCNLLITIHVIFLRTVFDTHACQMTVQLAVSDLKKLLE